MALSWTVIEPVRFPLAVGAKEMLMVQAAPALRTTGRVPQLLVSTKFPVMLMLVTVTDVFPVLTS